VRNMLALAHAVRRAMGLHQAAPRRGRRPG